MTKIEYTDRHRFMASMGLALIALAGIIPWLYLREPFDLLIETTKLSQLSPIAQEIISFRLKLVYYFSYSLPILLICVLVIGIILLWIGLDGWRKKQNVQDEKERLGNEALKRLLVGMAEGEITEKYLDPTLSEPSKTASQKSFKTKDSAMPKRILNSKSDAEITLSKAREIENKVLEKIEPIVKDEFEVMRQRKIAGRTFDAIFASKSSELWDRLVEIKYFSSKPTKDIFYRLHDRMVATALAYTEVTGRRARGITIVVVPDDEIKKATREMWFKPMIDTLKKKVEPGVSVIAESEIGRDDSDIAEIVWEVSPFELNA
jgi:hypothetical protein